MTRRHPLAIVGAACVGLLFLAHSAVAQQHRATHLGNPATRFAPPLRTPEDLRARFRDPKLAADIRAIVDQAGWKGDLRDLLRAAATARIAAVQIAPGTRLPFMSSRRNGRPIVLHDVLWDGQQSVEAYAFTFSSKGRRYRCLTPKPCSNFLLIDLGPDRPELKLELTAPPATGLCDPLEISLLVRNPGHSPLTGVRLVGTLPCGMLSAAGQEDLDLLIGTLRPGEVRILPVTLRRPATTGTCSLTVQATSAEGATDRASRSIRVNGPALEIICTAPAEVPIGRPVEICLTLHNKGDAPERKAGLTLDIPPGARVIQAGPGGVVSADRVAWEGLELGAGASRDLCVTLVREEPGPLPLEAVASGECAEPVVVACETRVAGVPGILLEVVDVEDPVEVGKDVVYRIRVTNQGTMALTQVRATCVPPENQSFVSGTGTTAVRQEDGSIVFDPVPVLEARATATWELVMRASAPGQASFRMDVTSDQLPRGLGESETTNQY